MKDASGQSLAYVYGRETKADADIANVLTMDEARRIASNNAKLPTLLKKGGKHAVRAFSTQGRHLHHLDHHRSYRCDHSLRSYRPSTCAQRVRGPSRGLFGARWGNVLSGV